VNPDELALSYFNSGYNCAESILMAVSETLHLNGFHPQRLATAFGAGIARQGQVCGCLTGAAMAASLAVGRVDGADQDSKELVYEVVGRIFDKFSERLHTIECRQLTGVDFTRKESVRDELTKIHKDVCCPLVTYVTMLAIAELQASQLPKVSLSST